MSVPSATINNVVQVVVDGRSATAGDYTYVMPRSGRLTMAWVTESGESNGIRIFRVRGATTSLVSDLPLVGNVVFPTALANAEFLAGDGLLVRFQAGTGVVTVQFQCPGSPLRLLT